MKELLALVFKAFRSSGRTVFAVLMTLTVLTGPAATSPASEASAAFNLTPPAGAGMCLPEARAVAGPASHGTNRQLNAGVPGLPDTSGFTVFLLRPPHAPFSLSMHQRQFETDSGGEGHARFAGIFSEGTFVVAPGAGATPTGLPDECVAPLTLFDGGHTAGIHALNTTTVPSP